MLTWNEWPIAKVLYVQPSKAASAPRKCAIATDTITKRTVL